MRNPLTTKRISRRDFGALLAAGATAGSVSACASRPSDPKTVTYWTVIADPITMGAWQQMQDGFQKANPGWTVEITPKPSVSTGDASSLITAVRGGTGPDIYLIDRFTAAQYATMGLLEDLQPYVDQTPGLKEQYLEFAWNEGSYRGHLFALPLGTDDRALYYSTDMLQAAGVDPSVFDVSNGPPLISDVIDIALKINKTNSQGNYTQMGMIPWGGQGFWATWGLMNGATFFDQGTCRITATQPQLVSTFEMFQEWVDKFNYNKVDTFNATYSPPGAPPQEGVFYTHKMGMQVDGNWALASLRQYAPHLKYGVTYLPVQKKGDPIFTWSGGFAMAVPKGAANPDGAWKFMQYACGEPGQRIYTQVTSSLPTYKPLLSDKKLLAPQRFFADILPYSMARPPLPVNTQLSDAMSAAEEAVLIGSSAPYAALKGVDDQLQGVMRQYCPFIVPNYHAA